MKILGKLCGKDEEGEVTLVVEDSEDLWHAYNLILVGDQVQATTTRKVVKDNGVSKQTNKVTLSLNVAVERIDFQPQATSLRVSGKVMNQNKFVKVGKKKRKFMFSQFSQFLFLHESLGLDTH